MTVHPNHNDSHFQHAAFHFIKDNIEKRFFDSILGRKNPVLTIKLTNVLSDGSFRRAIYKQYLEFVLNNIPKHVHDRSLSPSMYLPSIFHEFCIYLIAESSSYSGTKFTEFQNWFEKILVEYGPRFLTSEYFESQKDSLIMREQISNLKNQFSLKFQQFGINISSDESARNHWLPNGSEKNASIFVNIYSSLIGWAMNVRVLFPIALGHDDLNRKERSDFYSALSRVILKNINAKILNPAEAFVLLKSLYTLVHKEVPQAKQVEEVKASINELVEKYPFLQAEALSFWLERSKPCSGELAN